MLLPSHTHTHPNRKLFGSKVRKKNGNGGGKSRSRGTTAATELPERDRSADSGGLRFVTPSPFDLEAEVAREDSSSSSPFLFTSTRRSVFNRIRTTPGTSPRWGRKEGGGRGMDFDLLLLLLLFLFFFLLMLM